MKAKPMTRTPTKQKFSFQDYLFYDRDMDNHYELEDGDLLLMNPPTGRHALIIRSLYNILEAEIRRLGLPWVTLQGIGVRTSINRSRIPDLTIVSLEQIEERLDVSAVMESAPLFVVEIVSPESRIRDYRYKRCEYSVVGIPEYWIIDPEENKVTVLLLVEGLYEEIEYRDNDRVISQTFPELNLTVGQILPR